MRRESYSTKQHYQEIWDEAATLEEPKIGDLIELMKKKGNVGWFDADPYLTNADDREPEFKGSPGILHEFFHLFMNSGHTPYQEGVGGAANVGFSQNGGSWYYLARDMRDLLSAYRATQSAYYGENFPVSEQQRIKYQPRDTAIACAAGIYIYQKYNYLLNHGLRMLPYQAQVKLSNIYAELDEYVAEKQVPSTTIKELIPEMPAALLKLSDKEWRSIIAVATGMYDAKDTPYPNRLGKIQEGLEEGLILHEFSDKIRNGKHAANIMQKRQQAGVEGEPLHGWDGSKNRER